MIDVRRRTPEVRREKARVRRKKCQTECADAKRGKLGGKKPTRYGIYSGAGYSAVNEALGRMVCAVTGLSQTYSGEGLE